MKWKLPFGHRNIKKAVGLVLLAWLCFSLLYLISKLIGKETTVPTMVFFRNIVGLVTIIPFVLHKFPKHFHVKHPVVLLVRSLSGLAALIFMFLAIQRVSLVNATLLNNTAPFFVPILLLFWHKIPIGKRVWPAVVTGFLGIILILGPNREIFSMGAAWGLLAGICLAISTVTMKMTTKFASFPTFLFYFFLVGTLATLPLVIPDWNVPSWQVLLGLVLLGVFSTLGQLLFYNGMKWAKAEELAPLSYSTVLFAGVYDALIWGIFPPLIAYLGMALIIASGIWIIIFSRPEEIGNP